MYMCVLSACWMAGHWEYLTMKVLKCGALMSAHLQCPLNMSEIAHSLASDVPLSLYEQSRPANSAYEVRVISQIPHID